MHSVAAPRELQEMAGTWKVEQRMWASAESEADALPEALAERRIIGGAFLEEIMKLESASSEYEFTRLSYFNYNAMDQQYEYVSLNTRQPQIMIEKSNGGVRHDVSAKRAIDLFGESFVASQWGPAKDASFKYRLTIGPVQDNRQEVSLYLTPRVSGAPKEFLAFRYLYTRKVIAKVEETQ